MGNEDWNSSIIVYRPNFISYITQQMELLNVTGENHWTVKQALGIANGIRLLWNGINFEM